MQCIFANPCRIADKYTFALDNGYEVKVITHPHFGPEPVKVFAIKVNIDA